jgi:hypothetical protein
MKPSSQFGFVLLPGEPRLFDFTDNPFRENRSSNLRSSQGFPSAFLNRIEKVVSISPKEQMPGIDTVPHVALVEYVKALRHVSKMDDPRQSVCTPRIIHYVQATISKSTAASPKPAVALSSLLDLFPETVNRSLSPVESGFDFFSRERHHASRVGNYAGCVNTPFGFSDQ